MRIFFVFIFLVHSLYATEQFVSRKGKSLSSSRTEENVTLSGKILRTNHLPESVQNEQGIDMELETQKGVFNIHVGPMWWTAFKGAPPKAGEPVTVVGVRISFEKNPDIVAREITIHGKTFTVWERPERELTEQNNERGKK